MEVICKSCGQKSHIPISKNKPAPLYCNRYCKKMDREDIFDPFLRLEHPSFYRLVTTNYSLLNRDRAGVALYDQKERSCLRCGEKFLSRDPGHRYCMECTSAEKRKHKRRRIPEWS